MGKHRLILLRHGKSDWSTNAPTDFERPLTDRGRKAARQMGQWMRQQKLVPARVISSPARRARETSLLVAEQLNIDSEEIHWADSVYAASLNDLLAIVRKNSDTARSLLVIGHNPGLDDLLCYLSRDPVALTSDGKLLTTAAVAVLDYGAQPLAAKADSARLELLMRPRDLPGTKR